MISVLGIVAILGLACLLSENRKGINIRTVSCAFLLQVGIATIALYIPLGKDILVSISDSVQGVIEYANEGIRFVFGSLTDAHHGFIFAINTLPLIVFFSSLMSVLYYLGIMQKVVGLIGGLLRRALGTSQAESLSATANIFVGQTEAPLVIRPYLHKMTDSELFAVMVGGVSSVAGSVLVGYASMGVELKYLIAASFMAAPGGLLMAKIIKPETQAPDDHIKAVRYDEEQRPHNVIDAAASGALTGIQLAINIGAMLIAFIAIVALLNGMLGAVGAWAGVEGLTMQKILGYIFSPLAYLLGVPWENAVATGSLVGQKLVLNEFVAYIEFAQIKDTLPEKVQVISTFALCGFANLSSMAILLGGLGSLAPQRRPLIAEMGLKVVAAGMLANLMNAALAGLLFSLV